MTFDSDRPNGPEPLDPAQPASFPTQPVVSTGPRAPLVKPRSSSRALNAILAIAVVVAIAGVAFAVGRTTAPVAAANPRGPFVGGFPNGSFAPDASGAPGGGFGLGVGGGLTISGTVTAASDDALTLTTESGQTVQVRLDSDTEYRKMSDGTADDVTTGATVEVRLDFGPGVGRPTASSDPSAPFGTASTISVVP